MNRIRGFGTWLVTAVVTLAAGAGLVALDQTPQLAAVHGTSSTNPPSPVTTITSHSPRVVTPVSPAGNSIREAAEPVVQIESTTTTIPPTTTTSSTTTSTTNSTTSTTTRTTPETTPTTTTLPRHRGGGGDDGGGGSDDGGDD